MKHNIELMRLVGVILITFTHTRHNLEKEGLFYFIIEELPKLGTLILSLISGYLYWEISRSKSNLLSKKIKSLVIPYIIANAIVMIPALILNYSFNLNFLPSRLSYDSTLLTNGILSLNGLPINSPTYFIRDLFIVFVLFELIINKNLKMLLILIPLLFFGQLLLRFDILFIFIVGVLTSEFKYKVNIFVPIVITLFLTLYLIIYFPIYIKYSISFLIFITLIEINIKFIKTGGYSFILFLYHSPIMVLTFPILSMYIINPYLNIISQIGLALILTYILFFLTKKIIFLKILIGGR